MRVHTQEAIVRKKSMHAGINKNSTLFCDEGGITYIKLIMNNLACHKYKFCKTYCHFIYWSARVMISWSLQAFKNLSKQYLPENNKVAKSQART